MRPFCLCLLISVGRCANMSAMRIRSRFLAGLMAAVIAVPQAFSDSLPELGDAAGNELSLQTEKRVGQQIMNEIRLREPSYLDDPEVETYLNQIGGRLAAVSNDPGIGFYFFPIEDPMINAFAMPGGYIGVHTGLLMVAQSESELAGVLAHEISHVTQRHIARQMYKEKQVSIASMLAMGLALLAARSNTQVASAALASAQASSIQAQLNYSRDYEREADRIGFEVLQKAGFDVHGMSSFFDRLQKATRTLESNAPVYLRTHPLTVERLSDMQNREEKLRYRQVPDSPDFQLVRAKLRAMRGHAGDAVKDFRLLLADQKYPSRAAAQYGLAVALVRAKNWSEADQHLREAKKGATSAMLERLHAEIRIGLGDIAGGLDLYRDAMKRYPLNPALIFAYGDALVSQRRFTEALDFAEQQLRNRPSEARLYKLLAQSAAALGRRAQQHRALGEAAALQGQLGAAVEQFQLAQRAGDANFYEQSMIDARLRELKRQQAEEIREKRGQGGQ